MPNVPERLTVLRNFRETSHATDFSGVPIFSPSYLALHQKVFHKAFLQ